MRKRTKKQQQFCDKVSELLASDPDFARRTRGAFAADIAARVTKIQCPECKQWIEMGTFCGCGLAG
jgi:hypothetical protein